MRKAKRNTKILNPETASVGNHRDNKVQGLHLRVGVTGTKAWYVWIDGKRHNLGHYPAFGQATARNLALQDTVPGYAEKAARDVTVGQAIEAFIANPPAKKKKVLREATAAGYRRALRKPEGDDHLAAIRDMQLADVRREHLETMK